MHVRLNVKLAEVLEGVDLSQHAEGDVFELADADANLLIKGGWAEPVQCETRIASKPACRSAVAADAS